MIEGRRQGLPHGIGKSEARCDCLRFNADDEETVRQFTEHLRSSKKLPCVSFMAGTCASWQDFAKFVERQPVNGSRDRPGLQCIDNNYCAPAREVAEKG